MDLVAFEGGIGILKTTHYQSMDFFFSSGILTSYDLFLLLPRGPDNEASYDNNEVIHFLIKALPFVS